jgi:hypothetical protein
MTSQTAFRIDAGFSLFLALLAAGLIYLSFGAAEESVRKYGRNVDSGALEWTIAVLYCLPVALLFALAAVSFWRRWRIARYVHWFAVVCAVGPIAIEIGKSLAR